MTLSMDKQAINKLKNIVERIEKLEEEKRSLSDDIKEILASAQNSGYSVRAIKEVIKLRREDPETRTANETLRDLYCNVLGVELEPPLLSRMEGSSNEFHARG